MIKSMRYEDNPIKCLIECNKNFDCESIILTFNSTDICELYQTGIFNITLIYHSDELLKMNNSKNLIYFYSKKSSPKTEKTE